MDRPRHAQPLDRTGLALGATAYASWGLLPIYFKLLRPTEPIAIVAHRVVWSLLLLAILLVATRGWPAVRAAVGDRRTMLLLLLSASLVAVNWLIMVFAINSGRILASSLGYYLNPLANILLGRFLLGERLSRSQWIAVGIAVVGIVPLAAGALAQLWISLLLCATFAAYGLVRKVVAADALTGLAIETTVLTPFAVVYFAFAHAAGTQWLGDSRRLGILLIASGVISTVPLLLFTAAARRLPYSTMGMLQFLAPTLQFLVAVFLYGEPFTRTHAYAFAAIWTALGLYTATAIGQSRRDAIRLAER